MIGGLSTYDFPETHGGEMLKLVREAAGITEYLLPPLPNTIFTRDTTCWIYGGVTVNPQYWPARHEETILVTAIYKFPLTLPARSTSGGATRPRTMGSPPSKAAT